jgi:putative ABC transport system permease protein
VGFFARRIRSDFVCAEHYKLSDHWSGPNKPSEKFEDRIKESSENKKHYMFKSSLKFIFRNLWANRIYTSIKVAGLAIGMACTLFAILFIRHEHSYDKFHKNASRLYRVTTSLTNRQDGESRIMGATGQVQGPAFKAKIPEIAEYVRIWSVGSTNFIADHKALLLKLTYADESFFKVFSFPLLYGDPSSALSQPNSIVLTEESALRIFGKTDVLGKTIKLEEGHGMATFLISGVAKTIPIHSSIQFETVLPFTYLQTMFPDNNWLNSYLSTFVLLYPQADVNKVKNKFEQIFRDEAGDQLVKAKMHPERIKFGLQPLTQVHLNIFENAASVDTVSGTLAETSIATYSYLLMGIAAFILVMACVNFLNLSIAGSLKRSKEIGVRKISGGSRNQIVWQFLGEASILCGISYIIAILLVIAGLPIFNHLAQKNISFSFSTDIIFFLYGLILMCICILVVGLYPAIKLSMFNAIEVLYNRQKLGRKNVFTKSLIVLQFTLGISLVIATIIYYRQMNFISQKDLGYNAASVIEIGLPNFRGLSQTSVKLFMNQLLKDPSIKQVSNGTMIPGAGVDVQLSSSKITVSLSKIDEFFLPTLDIHLVEGRNFSGDFSSDSLHSIIVNETLVKIAGWKDPIGHKITMTDGLGISQSRTIVGVVKDYHYASLKQKIGPLVLVLDQAESLWVKLDKRQLPQGLSSVEREFKTTFPEYSYTYVFTEDETREQFANEQRWKEIISYSSALAIIICCMGLFGLAHFSTLKRTKEIGIRKVLGATAINISRLLSMDFLKLVMLSIIIASPIAWYAMNTWLQDFYYRIHISWMDFVMAALIALLIALVTVSSQTIRAAISNPVKSLRTE